MRRGRCRGRFKRAGDDIVLLLGESFGELGGSEYLKTVHGLVSGAAAAARSRREARADRAARHGASAAGCCESAHDCSDGGLAVTLAECAFDTGGIGFDGDRRRQRRRVRRRGALRRIRVPRRRQSVTPAKRRGGAGDGGRARRAGAADRTHRRRSPDRRGCRRPGDRLRGRRSRADLGQRIVAILHGTSGVEWTNRERRADQLPQSACAAARARASARARAQHRRRRERMPFKDECGVFGIFGHPEAANLTYLGLYALQHRGQESAGIATADGEKLRVSRAMGQVADAFNEDTLERASRAHRHRPHALLDRRREQARERAAVPDRLRPRPDRRRAQRQPRQRARAARRARAQRLDLPDQQRHRSRPAPLRALEGAARSKRR